MKKILWGIVLGAIIMISSSVSGNGIVQPPPPSTVPVVSHVESSPNQATVIQSQQVRTEPQLSNDNHYINTSGNLVHSPAYTSDNSIPAGATARCRDGTYSFSQNHRGSCSHHGGVNSWL